MPRMVSMYACGAHSCKLMTSSLDAANGPVGGAGAGGGVGVRAGSKSSLFERRILEAETGPIALYPKGILPSYKASADFAQHNPKSNAIFSVTFSDNLMGRDIKGFMGTARKNTKPDMLKLLKDYGVIVYLIDLHCQNDGISCTFDGASEMKTMPVNVLR
jgi:hypothetical protein